MRLVALMWLLVFVAAPAQASEGGGLAEHFWPAINLAILIAALVYFARKPIVEYFADRRGEVAGELKAAADQLGDAEATFAKWQRRLIDLETELEEIRGTSRQRAEAERERILEAARASAERIRRDATAAIDQELRRAREELREEATQLALEIAAERLEREVTDADRDRLLDEFIERVEQLPGVATGPGENH